MGFEYTGAMLPGSFPWVATSVLWASLIYNAYVGDRGGKEVVVFDCKFGRGRSSYRQTVIAVHGSQNCFGAERFDISLVTERAADWTLIFRPRRLLPLAEIQTLVSNI
jgi:hypothetical protein